MTQEPPKPPESALSNVPGVSIDPNRVMKPPAKRRQLTDDEYVQGVLAGNRAVIGRTFSLVESRNPAHREKAHTVLQRLLPHSGQAMRIGITGVPGVGKSTFIEAFGSLLVEQGHRVAVLTVDPSSEVSGGSIMGDKTRMENLSRNPQALVRPTACGGWLGGVARGTRESIVVCEAAGYDVVLVETVGVGQSETQVASMVDFFLLLMLAGAGDELQGMKKGIVEVADGIAINKADGDNKLRATSAKAQYEAALHLLRPASEAWSPRVLTCSAISGEGIPDVWKMVLQHRKALEETGELEQKRDLQSLYWLKQAVDHLLVDRFYRNPRVSEKYDELKKEVVEGRMSPFAAAEQLVQLGTGGETSHGGPEAAGQTGNHDPSSGG